MGPVTAQLRVDHDVKEKHKADPTDAARGNSRTGDDSAKVCNVSHAGREDMTERREKRLVVYIPWEKLLKPKPFKVPEKFYKYPRKVHRKEMAETREKIIRPKPFIFPEKFYEYPWVVQRIMAIRQVLGEVRLRPVAAPLQASQDLKEKHKAERTNADRENERTGDGPDKIRLKLQIRRGKMAETREKQLRLKLKEVRLGPVAAQLQVSQDLKEKQKADQTNASREKTKTGDGPEQIRLKLQGRRRKIAETRKKLLIPLKVPEKFYGYPRTTSWRAIRGDLFGGPVTAQLQVAQDVTEQQKADLTNAGRTGNIPAKIILRLPTGRGEVAEAWKKPLLHPRKKLHAEK